MSILILILKIIGWILLGILGLFLLISGILLFIPLRYDGEIEAKDELQNSYFRFRITWLLRIFEFRFTLNNKQTETLLRIFWNRRFFNEEESESISPSPATTPTQQESQEPEKHKEQKAKKSTSEIKPSWPQPQKNTKTPKKKKRRKEKVILNKDASIKEKLSNFTAIFSDENNQNAFKIVINELKYLCRHYGPRKLKADLAFSLGTPSYTGILVGMISVIPAVYHKGVHIHPDFVSEQMYLNGTATFKGQIRNVHVIKSLLVFLIKKETRNVLKKFMDK